jgi:hypothetical protein
MFSWKALAGRAAEYDWRIVCLVSKHFDRDSRPAALAWAITSGGEQRNDYLADWCRHAVLTRLTQNHAVAGVPLERSSDFAIAQHRGGDIGWRVAESHQDLRDDVVTQIGALRPRDR